MKSNFWYLFLFLLASVPSLVSAGAGTGFTPMIGIPGLEQTENLQFGDYVNALYGLAISVAALIAVVKIVLAGAKYMMDDIVTHKSEAKEDIKNSLIGLLIIIGAVIILTTINSDLTNLDVTATPVAVDLSIDEYLDRFNSQCTQAIANNTRCERTECSDLFNPNRTIEYCENVCRNVYGGFMDYNGRNECFYIQAVADECDPQQTPECCIRVKGGEWNDNQNTNKCTGLEDSLVNRISACYREGKTWDDDADTCRTTQCNRQTDSRCCEIGYGGTYTNGACSIDEINQDRDEENGTQDYQASQCVLVDGGLWNYNTRNCDPKDSQFGYEVISNQSYLDPNFNPRDVCSSLEEQFDGVKVDYIEEIRSCRWNL